MLRIETLGVAVGHEQFERGIEDRATRFCVGLEPALAPADAAGGEASHERRLDIEHCSIS